MNKVLVWIAAMTLLTGAIRCQTPEKVASPVAEIREVGTAGLLGSQQGLYGAYMTGPFIGGGLYRLRSGSMLDLIGTAYGVTADKIAGGPSWIAFNRYDIIARIPPGATPATFKPLLQALLADRFKLVVHNGESPVTVWGITATAKPLLKPSDGTGERGCKSQPVPASTPITAGAVSYACRNITMQGFADGLRGVVGANSLNGLSAVDLTNLKGSWNFDITFRRLGTTPPAGEPKLDFFEAIPKQLGLEVRLTKVPLPALVVDSVNPQPTPDPPNLAEVLPKLPATFEVAEVKPVAPDAAPNRGYTFQMQPGGRVRFQNFPLAPLIQRAWEISSRESLVGPKFLDSEKVEIVALVPALEGTAAAGTNAGKQDDLVNAMLRSLITERYKLEAHQESRPVTAYTLRAVKPKLRKADPSNRSGCLRGLSNAAASTAANSVNTNTFDCQNMTMAQFATFLQNSAYAGLARASVLDATALDGARDFTLTFSPLSQTTGGNGGDPAGDTPAAAASTPNGRITLFEAIESQLGLKLETTKRPGPVLVIDRMEQRPLQ